MTASHHVYRFWPAIPVAVALALALAAGAAAQTDRYADPSCDLSFSDTPCATLPCPTAFAPAKCPPGQGPGLPGAPPWVCHPYPQPRPSASKQCTTCDGDGCVTLVNTGEGKLPPSNPFDYRTFPGTNLLPNVPTNAFDGLGNEIANTLPSTPNVPYNLHDGDPIVSTIDHRSPADDLSTLIRWITRTAQVDPTEVYEQMVGGPPDAEILAAENAEIEHHLLLRNLRIALDIVEGEPVPDRVYSGFPLLHYEGPSKVKLVQPIRDGNGDVIGGNVDVHQIWYGQHIEADTGWIDPTPVLGNGPDGEPLTWTITYTIDVLSRGHDDFSPFVTYTDNPEASPYFDSSTCSAGYSTLADCQQAHPSGTCKQKGPIPNIGMDQTFFDMEEGTRTVFKIKMAPAKYLNLVYTWGWRMHPPRIQVMEKAIKKINYTCNDHTTCPDDYQGCMLPQLEQGVFCNPDDPATEKISAGEDFTPPWYDPSMTAIENTCNIAGLPNCDAVRCAPGEARFDGGEPTQCERNKHYAIGKIGDLSPAKRMWRGFGKALAAAEGGDGEEARKIVSREVTPAFFAWQNRTHLPCFDLDTEAGGGQCVDGVNVDPDSDITILYVNNTIYGQLTAGGWVRWPDWESRYTAWQEEDTTYEMRFSAWETAMAAWVAGPKTEPAPERPRRPPGPPILDVTAYNDDRFPHSYTIADFGGSRGWENQFKSSTKVAGSGCWFTFGRAYWWMPAGAPNGFLCVDAAEEGSGPTVHKFHVQFNFEPSRRLRFYQFDPMHHDVAIFSIH